MRLKHLAQLVQGQRRKVLVDFQPDRCLDGGVEVLPQEAHQPRRSGDYQLLVVPSPEGLRKLLSDLPREGVKRKLLRVCARRHTALR